MRLSSLPAAVVIVGTVISIVGIVIGAMGGSAGFRGPGATNLLDSLAVLLIGLGVGGLSLVAIPPVAARAPRSLLALDGIGFIGLGLTASANTGPDTSPLLLVLVASIAVLAIALPLTAVALLLRSGPTRVVGILVALGCGGAALQLSTGSPIALVMLAGIPIGFAALGASALGSAGAASGAPTSSL